MQQPHKQRLLGAVVLVALAVIFLPMLLTGPVERTRVDVPLDVPEEPEAIDAPALPEPDLPAERDPGAELASEPRPLPDEAPAAGSVPPGEAGPVPEAAGEPAAGDAAEPPEQAADAADTRDGGFAVQVGGFGSRDNALRLRDQLREDDFATWVDEAEVDGRTVYRVRVGPVADRGEAEALAQRLAEAHELPGLIIAR